MSWVQVSNMLERKLWVRADSVQAIEDLGSDWRWDGVSEEARTSDACTLYFAGGGSMTVWERAEQLAEQIENARRGPAA